MIGYFSRGDTEYGIHRHIQELKKDSDVKEVILVKDSEFGYVVGARIKTGIPYSDLNYFSGDFIATNYINSFYFRPKKLPKRFQIWWAYD